MVGPWFRQDACVTFGELNFVFTFVVLWCTCSLSVWPRGRVCFRPLSVAMGDELDDEERSDLEVEISEALKASRHGVKLSNKLVDNMVVFFIESVKVDSIEDVPMDEPDELEECAREAWQDGYSKPLPGVLALKVRKWTGEKIITTRSTKETPLAGAGGVGEVVGEDRRRAADKEAIDLDLTPFEREKAVKDMSAQGLSAARIVAFSLSLVLGKVCKMSVSASLKYGEDPALSDPAKQARKASRKLLATVIKNKDYGELGAFFSDLMRAYAADALVEESALIATWWAETSSCFASDKELLFKYVEDYFDKYAGRGLPVVVDTLLVTRLRNSSAGSGFSKEEGKKLMIRSSEFEAQMTKMKNEINTLKQQLGNLGEEKKKPKISAEEQASRQAKVTCHNCGEVGHYASQCPKKTTKDE